MKYSVAIRTLGNAGKKYEELLNSIEKQAIRPDEVIVVLPYGYELPNEKLGWERYVFSQKGLAYQRIAGIEAASNDLVLCLDDDLSFGADFAEHLAKPILENRCEVSIAPLPEILPMGLSSLKMCMLGSAAPILFNREKWFLKVRWNGGFLYNKFYNRKHYPDYLLCQTAPCACMMLRKQNFTNIHYENELWLEKQNGYAFGDDQVLFYKLFLNDNRIFCVTREKLIHLNAGASGGGNNERREYASAFFKEVFFDRFILRQEKSCLLRMLKKSAFCTTKYLYWVSLRIISLRKKDYVKRLMSNKKGTEAALKYMKQTEYLSLPPVIENE